jgi:hypothetical protein
LGVALVQIGFPLKIADFFVKLTVVDGTEQLLSHAVLLF